MGRVSRDVINELRESMNCMVAPHKH
jgi:hypothetical protein